MSVRITILGPPLIDIFWYFEDDRDLCEIDVSDTDETTDSESDGSLN